MIRTLPLLALLSACAVSAAAREALPSAPVVEAQRDYTGQQMPVGCRFDLATVTANVPVFLIDQRQVERIYTATKGRIKNGYRIEGITTVAVFPFVFVSNQLGGWKAAEIRTHELYHAACIITNDPCCVGHFAPGL